MAGKMRNVRIASYVQGILLPREEGYKILDPVRCNSGVSTVDGGDRLRIPASCSGFEKATSLKMNGGMY